MFRRGARKRSVAAGEEDSLRESLLGVDDEASANDTQASSSGRGANGSVGERSGALDALLRLLGDALALCASRFGDCFGWLFGALGQAPPSPAQLAKLAALRESLKAKFNHDNPHHEDALAQLWALCFPGEEWHSGPNARWTEAGFQGKDPGSDFRGGGLFALLNLLYMAQHHNDTFRMLMYKTNGERADNEYPFSAAGINITYKLMELLELKSHAGADVETVPRTAAGLAFVRLLESDTHAFEELYVATFEVLDRQWLAMKASYMDFPRVLQVTMHTVERVIQMRLKSLVDVREALML